MSQDDKEPKFFKWVYAPLIAPAVLLVFGAIVTEKTVIRITGVQLNIGLTIAIIVFIYLVMVISFFLGMFYLPCSLLSYFTHVKMPWYLHVFFRIASFPVALLIRRKQKRWREQEQKRLSQNPLAQRVLQELKKESPHEPPSSNS